jgi:hypothetical protein
MRKTITAMQRTSLLLALFFVSFFAQAQTWDKPLNIADPAVSTGGDVGKYNSMLMVNGKPAIVTYNATNTSLLYYRATDSSGTTWANPITIDAGGSVGISASLELVNGNPAVAYYDSLRGDLLYVRANDSSGNSWGTPVRVGGSDDVGKYISMKIINGNPAIAYFDQSDLTIRYVRANNLNGTSWGSKPLVYPYNHAGFGNSKQ